MTLWGAEAQMPHRSRKMTSAVYEGATEQAAMKMRYPTNVLIRTGRRPRYSLIGPKRSGPSTYPDM